jgi:zinc D-Ala-D-Ala carboxypeptidase
MTWTGKHFTEDEMRCHCGCRRVEMAPEFIDKLEQLRIEYGRPMAVTSGFRCLEHNAAVGGAEHSAHVTGQAADFNIPSQRDADRLIELAYKHGFGGKGVRLHGHVSGWMIHLDTLDRSAIWTYP